jgi:uncharacterized membrane protein YoaK (UPF0700 family)
VEQRPRSLAANVRLVADDRSALRHEKVGSPAIVVYSLISGCGALGVGAVASFAASSAIGKLVLWMVFTTITAVTAGIAYESRWVRGFSYSVIRWIQSIDRPY